ncbi:MAG: hypothetical protein LLG02_01435 [Pelosinus sp.]|nr:hypothetical protein [Pelosinus sp.]
MKDPNSALGHTQVEQTDTGLDCLEDSSADLSHMDEKHRLSTAMSSYYLLYR